MIREYLDTKKTRLLHAKNERSMFTVPERSMNVFTVRDYFMTRKAKLRNGHETVRNGEEP